MKYDITKPQAPKMPTLGKGTECIQILLYKAIKHPLHPSVQHPSPSSALTFAPPKLTPHPSFRSLFCANPTTPHGNLCQLPRLKYF